MYERMLNKQVQPTLAEMSAYCGERNDLFLALHEWLGETFQTTQTIVFPYGNHYGWGVAHRQKKTLLCNVFPERDAFCVMVRCSDAQFAQVYDQVSLDMQEQIDHRYPCGDGGWLHFHVLNDRNFQDLQTLFMVKCAKKK